MLSIIITTRNRKKDLLACLKSLYASTYQNFEVVVVDDCSDDGTEKLTAKGLGYKNLRIAHAEKQLMMVGARNIGAKIARGDYLLFVDDDNEVDKEMVANLMSCAIKNPSYVVIGAPVYFFADKKKYFAAQKFNFFTGASKTIIARKIKKGLIDSDSVPNVFLTTKKVLEKSNYFDPELIQTLTDLDFCMAARGFGYQCGVCQEAITYHKVTVTDNLKPRHMGGTFPQKSYCLIRNRMVVIKRYGNLTQKLTFLILFCWFWPLSYSVLAIRGNRLDLVKFYWIGYIDGLWYFLTKRLRNSLPKLMKKQNG